MKRMLEMTRKIAETKSKEIKNEIEQLQKDLQEEKRKRKSAEDKTKIAVKQAHSAMLNLLDEDNQEYPLLPFAHRT